jgi:hypothetical protein
MLQVGDKVIIMSAPGTFTVVAVAGDQITIENASGLRKTVLAQAARRVEPPAESSGGS